MIIGRNKPLNKVLPDGRGLGIMSQTKARMGAPAAPGILTATDLNMNNRYEG